jgi:DNA-binding transcriptional MocR family regulator
MPKLIQSLSSLNTGNAMSGKWVPDLSGAVGPKYLAVAGEIARAIESGDLGPGDQLPPQRDLAELLGVTVGTVSRAYALARKHNLVSGEVGRGTFITGARAEQPPRTLTPQADAMIDLQSFAAAPNDQTTQWLARALGDLAERVLMMPLHKYPPNLGAEAHRAAGATWLTRCGLPAEADDVLPTYGAQEALSICLDVLAQRGDTVLAEAITYSGLKSMAAIKGLHVQPLEMDDEGVTPDALVREAARTGARVVYLQPTVHNPTARTMSSRRRNDIVRVIRKHNLLLIEDDAAISALRERPAPLSAQLAGSACYITSLSKFMSPVVRVGYLHASGPLIGALGDALYTNRLGPSALTLELGTSLVQSGMAETLADAYLDAMKRCGDVARAIFTPDQVRIAPGANYLWLNIPKPWSADEFVRAARQQGLAIPYLDNFQVDGGTTHPGTRVTLNAALAPEVLTACFTQLSALLAARPTRYSAIV